MFDSIVLSIFKCVYIYVATTILTGVSNCDLSHVFCNILASHSDTVLSCILGTHSDTVLSCTWPGSHTSRLVVHPQRAVDIEQLN